MENQPSPRWTLNKKDIKEWSINTAKFFAPAVLLYLAVLKTGGTIDQANIALYGWGVNTAYGLVWRFIQG